MMILFLYVLVCTRSIGIFFFSPPSHSHGDLMECSSSNIRLVVISDIRLSLSFQYRTTKYARSGIEDVRFMHGVAQPLPIYVHAAEHASASQCLGQF
ncbi:hypothetical protein F5Y17DRAFT_5953 [Xylariaceae sp. FL0594]|nr:hypothetical protein F5Y17DRAFT_5953 [Xylariaceae sp. FL0594]